MFFVKVKDFAIEIQETDMENRMEFEGNKEGTLPI